MPFVSWIKLPSLIIFQTDKTWKWSWLGMKTNIDLVSGQARVCLTFTTVFLSVHCESHDCSWCVTPVASCCDQVAVVNYVSMRVDVLNCQEMVVSSDQWKFGFTLTPLLIHFFFSFNFSVSFFFNQHVIRIDCVCTLCSTVLVFYMLLQFFSLVYLLSIYASSLKQHSFIDDVIKAA